VCLCISSKKPGRCEWFQPLEAKTTLKCAYDCRRQVSLTAAPDATTTLIGTVIGLGNIAGGLYKIKREPASIVEIDNAAREIRVCRWYPIGKRHKTYPLSALLAFEVEITEHSEGGSVYRPRLRFGKDEFVAVSLFWYQTREPSEAILKEIRSFLDG
jgi:hypothetical protein